MSRSPAVVTPITTENGRLATLVAKPGAQRRFGAVADRPRIGVQGDRYNDTEMTMVGR